ncbi:uncharacterized protein LOC127253177 isoform X2 [Andrographis paniculata]|nr:uncharacterized protein LOC127253177 isoform X2 [Andrographis paniculata]
MTLQVQTVNLLLEIHGRGRRKGGATWASPMASITVRNLLLYTTNENWEVVNLKEARDFSNDKKFIYVFRKLEWEHLSIDLLPHPDMFSDPSFSKPDEGSNRKDEDGAKRAFFGGERFIEGISGEAYITIQRTELNSPVGLEVQLHVSEVVCPALSEPGLRALLRFFTGVYVCLNRGDVNPLAQNRSVEAAGRSLVSIIVDHIFLCIRDSEFQLELLMQSLSFSRASVSDGATAKYLTQVMVGGFFLRDTFSRPPCTLVQPSMQDASVELHDPDFAKDFCPPIYPLGDHKWRVNCHVPLIGLHSLQLLPSPNPPTFATKTVIDCQPLMIHLQEESCLRISSFLADGIVVSSSDVLPDFSINSLSFNLKGLDVTVPLKIGTQECLSNDCNMPFQSSFTGARLHIEDLIFSESPSLILKLLNLEKDPACFCLWESQPIDASQKKLATGASLISLSLETGHKTTRSNSSCEDLWRCVEMKDLCLEVAMVTADGSPLTNVPPPGGVVRFGISFQQYVSNSSVEQLFFVLDVFAYFGRVSEQIAVVGKNKKEINDEALGGNIMEKAPGDTAATLAVKDLQLKFLESSSSDTKGIPLVRFMGDGLSVQVSHRTLGGALAISSSVRWERVEVDCTDTVNDFNHENDSDSNVLRSSNVDQREYGQLRPVFWIHNSRTNGSNHNSSVTPFIDVSTVHVIPYSAQDIECHSLNVSACISGVRLGGGMNYTESLLHRFGILGPDGGPGEDLTKGLEQLSKGPLWKLFKTSPQIMDGIRENGSSEDGKDHTLLHVGPPDDVDMSIELKDWLFALEDAQNMPGSFLDSEECHREERSWHTTFRSIHVKAKSSPKLATADNNQTSEKQKHSIDLITVGLDGLQILKPTSPQVMLSNGISEKEISPNGSKSEKQSVGKHQGVNMAVDIVASDEDDGSDAMAKWVVENLKFSVTEPIEAVVKKDELQYLAYLCKAEVESLGRITAGVLRILKLESSVGSAAIHQLSNLGSEGIDRIFTPEKLSRGSSASSLSHLPSGNADRRSWNSGTESTVASLEAAIVESQKRCAALAELSNCKSESESESDSSSRKYLNNVKELNEKLDGMKKLLEQLKSEILK